MIKEFDPLLRSIVVKPDRDICATAGDVCQDGQLPYRAGKEAGFDRDGHYRLASTKKLTMSRLQPLGGYSIVAGGAPHMLLMALRQGYRPTRPTLSKAELIKEALPLLEDDGDLGDGPGTDKRATPA